MAKRRTTFGKMQRERDKKERMTEKLEKRATRADGTEEEGPVETAAPVDQGKVIAQLDELHKRYDDGQINEEDFEEKRAALLALLAV